MKVIAGCGLCFFNSGQLPETGLAQAPVTAQEAAALAADRLGGDGGELVILVGFMEGTEGQADPAQTIQALVEAVFVGKAADHEVRMGREKRSGHLDGGVAGLHDLLRERKVAPHKDVHIRRRFALGELHRWLLSMTGYILSAHVWLA